MRESLMMNSVFFEQCLEINIYVNFRIPQGVGRHRGVLDGAVSPPELIITTSQNHMFSLPGFVCRPRAPPPLEPRSSWRMMLAVACSCRALNTVLQAA